ncbi:MAG TPA: S41 family peptidase [Nannocystaceae bacterium]|nr:S41 family peptidase [Nannocystaceae bacterium]
MSPRAGLLAIGLLAVACAPSPPADAPPSDTKVEAKQPEPTSPRTDAPRCADLSLLDVSKLPPLPESPHAQTLQQVWQKVLEKHYDPTLGCVDWPALRLSYAQKLVGVDDRNQAYDIINEMLGELGQSHFRLFAPGGRSEGDERVGPAEPPLRVRWVDERLVVTQSQAKGHLGAVRPGSTLLAVENRELDDAIAKVKARTDRPSELAFELGRIAESRLSCARAGQTRELTLAELDAKGAERKVVRTVTCALPEGKRVTLGNLENIPTRVEHRMIDPALTKDRKIGYLAFNVWMLPMVKRVEEAMAELRGKGMQALVLDLRGNPGGVGAMSVPVARLLLESPGSLGKLQFRDFTQEFNVDVGNDPFKGEVVLLVDEGTASTSEIFAAGLRDLSRAQVIGARASAGAALPSVIDELPGGAILQYVVGDYRSPKGTVIEGVGVVPDVTVVETRADFAAGKDPVLLAAIERLASGEQSGKE